MTVPYLRIIETPVIKEPDLDERIDEVQAATREEARSILRVVNLSPELRDRITEALIDISAGRGAESTIERIIFEGSDPAAKTGVETNEKAIRQDVIRFIGEDLLKAVETKITALERTEFKNYNRAGLLPLELALFARHAQKIDPSLADKYRAGFLKLYARIMTAASDEELRKNNTGNTISADWPSYCTILKRDILNPIFMDIATQKISAVTEDALQKAEPAIRRFDKQTDYTGVTLLKEENILGQAQVIDMNTHPLGVRDPQLKETYTKRLRTYFNLA